MHIKLLHYPLFLAYNSIMKITKKKLSVLLTVIMAVCLITACVLLIQSLLSDKHSEETLEALRVSAEDIERSNAAAESGDTASGTSAESNDTASGSATVSGTTDKSDVDTEAAASSSESPAIVNPYKDSFLANEDMAAWLQIPDTNIDYPIMWTPRDENYYLYRDFEGNDNKNGCLILDTDSSLDPLTTNLIIHGHNMRSGAMFGNLTDYENSDYYEKHKQITLYTEECRRNYEVIAVFRSQVYKKTDEVFKFYKFFQADTQEEFDDFYQNIKALSLYDTGVTAQFGDHFLTLSTCVYHVEQGRFVVVAKEVESGDVYLPIVE